MAFAGILAETFSNGGFNLTQALHIGLLPCNKDGKAPRCGTGLGSSGKVLVCEHNKVINCKGSLVTAARNFLASPVADKDAKTAVQRWWAESGVSVQLVRLDASAAKALMQWRSMQTETGILDQVFVPPSILDVAIQLLQTKQVYGNNAKQAVPQRGPGVGHTGFGRCGSFPKKMHFTFGKRVGNGNRCCPRACPRSGKGNGKGGGELSWLRTDANGTERSRASR